MLKGNKGFFRNSAEIAPGHSWVTITLAPQETTDVPSIFAQQTLSLIFRVPLKAHEKTSLVLLYEAINACGGRFGEDVIAALRKIIFAHLIPSRMRDSQAFWNAQHQGMMHGPGLVENPDAFIR